MAKETTDRVDKAIGSFAYIKIRTCFSVLFLLK